MTLFKKFFHNWQKKDDDPIESEDLENLDAESRGMVRGIVELAGTSAKEVMIPRIDTVFASESTDTGEKLKALIESGHSRFPVYRDTIDNVVGILYVKDLLPYLMAGKPVSIRDVLRSAYFVPESMKLDSLLREMKERRVHLAVAVDEYGGVSGILSMEDILEEIVGDIQDEFDDEDEDIVVSADNEWICDARVNLEDLNDTLGSNIPKEDFDSLGGFVFNLFGKIPELHESIRWNDLLFVVKALDGHKIQQIKIIRDAADEDE